MNETIFWKIIDSSRAQITPELSNQPEILVNKLATLPAAEIVEFQRIFDKLHADAYNWNLWAAAYIIEGGCSDDGFADFRAGLIGLGKEAYYEALNDPNTLVKQPTQGVDFSQEELIYAARDAYRESTGCDMPDTNYSHPQNPTGTPWDEDLVDEKYPELAVKFGANRN